MSVNSLCSDGFTPLVDCTRDSQKEEPPIDKVTNQATQIIKNNGDCNLDTTKTILFCGIDLGGGARQTSVAVENTAKLLHRLGATSSAASSAISPVVAGAVLPLGLLITGPLSAATALLWTLPEANDKLVKAEAALAEATAKETPSDEEIGEARQVVKVAELGVRNQRLYFGMGVGQTGLGTVTMLGSESASAFKYSPVLTGSAGATATLVAGVALGVIYAARGGIMFRRALINNQAVNNFYDAFKQTKDPEAAIEFMQKAEERGESYLNRRVDPSCLQEKTTDGTTIEYTAKGKKINGNSPVPYEDGGKEEYLKRVDKGIYTERLKTKISMAIAISMIIGGILALTLSILTGGLATIVIGLIGAIFFMGMEFIFLTYDSSGIFEKLRNYLYSRRTVNQGKEVSSHV